MNVRCGLCGNTWGCDCAAQEQLFAVAQQRKCAACGTTKKNLCGHDANLSEGLISRTRRRPASCLNSAQLGPDDPLPF